MDQQQRNHSRPLAARCPSECTYLVTDTSVLIGNLPFIRAIIECPTLAHYVIYIPYMVLTELDAGRSAAAVNQLISHHMRHKSTRLEAQPGRDHDDVFQAKGIASNNDDIIMGTALRLLGQGKRVIMVSNDHNLIVKCCANRLEARTTFDMMRTLPQAIAAMRKFIAKDIVTLCPHPNNLTEFVVELLACALRAQLQTVDPTFESRSSGHSIINELIGVCHQRKVFPAILLARTENCVRDVRRLLDRGGPRNSGNGGSNSPLARRTVVNLVQMALQLLDAERFKGEVAAAATMVLRCVHAGLCTAAQQTPPNTLGVKINFNSRYPLNNYQQGGNQGGHQNKQRYERAQEQQRPSYSGGGGGGAAAATAAVMPRTPRHARREAARLQHVQNREPAAHHQAAKNPYKYVRRDSGVGGSSGASGSSNSGGDNASTSHIIKTGANVIRKAYKKDGGAATTSNNNNRRPPKQVARSEQDHPDDADDDSDEMEEGEIEPMDVDGCWSQAQSERMEITFHVRRALFSDNRSGESSNYLSYRSPTDAAQAAATSSSAAAARPLPAPLDEEMSDE